MEDSVDVDITRDHMQMVEKVKVPTPIKQDDDADMCPPQKLLP